MYVPEAKFLKIGQNFQTNFIKFDNAARDGPDIRSKRNLLDKKDHNTYIGGCKFR